MALEQNNFGQFILKTSKKFVSITSIDLDNISPRVVRVRGNIVFRLNIWNTRDDGALNTDNV